MYFTGHALFKAQRTQAWYKGVNFRSKHFHCLSHRIPVQSWGNQAKFLSTHTTLFKNGDNGPSFLPPFYMLSVQQGHSPRTAWRTSTNPAKPTSATAVSPAWGGFPFSEPRATCAVPVTRGSLPHPGSQGTWVGSQPYHFTGHPLCGLIVRGPSVHHCQEEDDVQFHGSADKSNYG